MRNRNIWAWQTWLQRRTAWGRTLSWRGRKYGNPSKRSWKSFSRSFHVGAIMCPSNEVMAVDRASTVAVSFALVASWWWRQYRYAAIKTRIVQRASRGLCHNIWPRRSFSKTICFATIFNLFHRYKGKLYLSVSNSENLLSDSTSLATFPSNSMNPPISIR